ncbi:MAG: SAM-dependent methyltransferase [Chthoniobacterales bacterium]
MIRAQPQTPLARQLYAELTSAPPLRFDAFMARALFDSQHGYYAGGHADIGRNGDFYTSVTATRMFGRILADHFATVWESLGRPADFTLVEQGANDGTFAADVLTALIDRHPALSTDLRLHLIEPFEHLRKAQRSRLKSLAPQLVWHDTIDDLPPFTGVHFTNEFVDALPIRVIESSDHTWQEWYVTAHDGDLAIVHQPTDDDLPPPARDGDITELRPAASDWLTTLAPKLRRGEILICDYGDLRDGRPRSTLTGYRRHQRTDNPLDHVGEQDLTAHVDFTSLTDTATAAGLTAAPLTDQYHFLVNAGRALLLDLEKQPDTAQRASDLRGFKTLLHPEIMGTQFKFLTLTR